MVDEPNSAQAESLIDQYYEVTSLPPRKSDVDGQFGVIDYQRGSKVLILDRGAANRALAARGLLFPEGSSATTNGLQYAGIYMRNTQKNHEKLRSLLDSIGAEWEIRSPGDDGANKPE